MVPNAQSAFADVQFDISWDNSWRQGMFYDVAWVFVKISVNDGDWFHAKISGVNSIGTGTGLTIDLSKDNAGAVDNKGVYIYRSAQGTGSLNTTAIKLKWNRQDDGVLYNSAKVKVKVFAVEMVKIPQGAFYVGDGTAIIAGTYNHFFDAASSPGAVVKVTSTQPYISSVFDGTGLAGDISWYPSTNYPGALPTSRTQLNTDFPTGYKSFYCMKYEVTQGQYRDFLNTLTRNQQVSRVASTISADTVTNVFVMVGGATVTPPTRVSVPTPTNYGNSIACPASGNGTVNPITFFCDLNNNGIGNESTDGEWIACNYLSWADLCAYADWAGLRPMTELEFEKAARGPKASIAGEYAWGTATIAQATGITNPGAYNEAATPSTANCVYGGAANVYGPMRVGVTSTATSTTRATSGASYYGIRDLSGSLWERPVSVMGSQTGTALSLFTGVNGDGKLTSVTGNYGNADVTNWPGTDASGSGPRGGNWFNGSTSARVSVRYYAASPTANRSGNVGGRLVRTSP